MAESSASANDRLLDDVNPEHVFRLNGGGEIRNLRELYSAFRSMEDSSFDHHVSAYRNDFANWVKDIHRDYRLSNSLFLARSREECRKAVSARLYEIEKSVESALLSGEGSGAVEENPMMLLAPLKEGALVPVKEETESDLIGRILSEAAIAKSAERRFESISEKRNFNEEEIKAPASEVFQGDGPGFASSIACSVSSIFSSETFSSFVGDMKKVFIPDRAAIAKSMSSGNADSKKESMLSYLKRVYK